MVLKVKVKQQPGGSFTQCQLNEIAASLCVTLPDSIRPVWYGQTPPADSSMPWQPTNGADDPVGKVKSFVDGEWK